MRGAREIDERRRICRYVEARRSSATKQVSLFQQPVKFRPCSLKERAFNQHRFRGALLVRSAGDWRAIGVEAHVLFVRTGADASHHKRSITGIAELIVATRRQNNGLVLARL